MQAAYVMQTYKEVSLTCYTSTSLKSLDTVFRPNAQQYHETISDIQKTVFKGNITA